VELQVSFVVVPLKKHAVKLQTVLHSVALLDGQFSKVKQNCSLLTVTVSLLTSHDDAAGSANQKTERPEREDDEDDHSPRGVYDVGT
jgi:hypothetical protein